jgi:hypothetical protein
MEGRAMDDRARLNERHFALRQHLEALASQVSELEILRGQVAKAERRIFGAARETRKAVYEEVQLARPARDNLNRGRNRAFEDLAATAPTRGLDFGHS